LAGEALMLMTRASIEIVRAEMSCMSGKETGQAVLERESSTAELISKSHAFI
jgi:hypothetical protein